MKCYSLFAILLLIQFSSADNAIIQGYVRDKSTGAPFRNVVVEIYSTDDSSRPIASTRTNDQGFYGAEVVPEKYYDVFVRVGDPNPNQRTSTIVVNNSVYTINFEIQSEISHSQVMIERYGFWIVVIVATVILVIILIDQIFLRKKRIIKSLEQEKEVLEKKLEKEEVTAEDEMTRLQKETDQIEYMINLTKIKFHKRQLDEESFREIVRDYQKKLIELEAKINRLKT